MKKALSAILSIVMLFSLAVGIDFSAYAETSGDYEYEILDDGTVEINIMELLQVYLFQVRLMVKK